MCHPEKDTHSNGLCNLCYKRKRRQDYLIRNPQPPKPKPKYKINKEIRQREVRRNYNLKKKYAIDDDSYLKLVQAQNGKCAICKKDHPGYSNFAVDHNHDTGQIRGILCKRCNIGLGYFKDDYNLLEAAATYLRYPRDLQLLIYKA